MKTFLGVTLTLSDLAGDTTDTDNTQWIDNTGCQPSVPVIHSFIGVSLDSVNVRLSMLLKNPSYYQQHLGARIM